MNENEIKVTYDKNLIKVLETLHGVDANRKIIEMVIAGTEKELGRTLKPEEIAYIVLRDNNSIKTSETFEYVISKEFKDSSEDVLRDLKDTNDRKKKFEIDVLTMLGKCSTSEYVIKMYNARLDEILEGKRKMAMLRRYCDKLIEENVNLSERLGELTGADE